MTINEIQNVYAVPKSLQQEWAARSYHGDAQNNSRAVINRFLGFYDGNPVNQAGKAKFDGDRKPFDPLRGLMVSFSPRFEILPGTVPKTTPSAGLKPFEVPDALAPDSSGD